MFNLSHLVTLNVTPGWQPTSEDTGKTAEFWCGLASYVVEWTDHTGKTHLIHGEWTDQDNDRAQRYARSMDTRKKARAVVCESYYYAPAYGMIDREPIRLATPQDRKG